MTGSSNGGVGSHDGNACAASEERLWSPIDPSGLLRSCCGCNKPDLHSQLVFNHNPSEVLRVTGNNGPLPSSTVHVVPTGERIVFPQSSTAVCQRLVDSQLSTNGPGSGSSDTTHRKLVANRGRGDVDDLHDTGGHTTTLAPCETGCGYDSSAEDVDLQGLFDNITGNLRRLPLVSSACELCCNNCMVSKDADMTLQAREQPFPCPHSLSLRHTPEAYNMKIFDDAISAKVPLQEVYRRGAEPHHSVDVYTAKLDNISKRIHPAASLPSSTTVFEKAVFEDGPHVDVDYLLTYRPETLQGDAYNLTGPSTHRIEASFDTEHVDDALLKNLDITVLRNVASRIPSKSKAKVDIASLLDELTASKADETKGQFSRDSTIALTGAVSDRHDYKRSQWVCPNEFRVTGVMRQQPRSGASSRRFESRDGTFTSNRFSIQDSTATSRVFSAYPSQSFDMMPIAQLQATGRELSIDSSDDMYYDNDMSLDTLMSKYLRLRKDADCPDSIRRTLKHLICFRQNKDRLYLRRRMVTSENGHDTLRRDANIMSTTLHNILNRIGFYDATVHSTDEILNMEQQGNDGNCSEYTYSSITVSSYQSFYESVFAAIDSRTIAQSTTLDLHDNMVDIYGILTVSDENRSKIIPGDRSEMYCELRGKALYFYSLRSYVTTAAKLIEEEPSIILQLDESFTCVGFNDRKTGDSLLRVTGERYTIKGQKATIDDEHDDPFDKAETGDDDSYIMYLKLFSSHDDIWRWYKALSARSKIRSFLSLLENGHQLVPYNWNIYFMLYPKLMELDLSCLTFDVKLESRIVGNYVTPPIRRLISSRRDISDLELVDFISTWCMEIDTLDLSGNVLTLNECGPVFVDFIHRAKVRYLCLDDNPLSPDAFDLLGGLFFGGCLQTLSMRGCRLYDKVIPMLKQLNQKMDVKDRFFVDLRDCTGSDDTLHFIKSYPFNRVKVISLPSHAVFREMYMECFVDSKSVPDIYALGTTLDGRLLSARSLGFQNPVKWLRSKQDSGFRIPFCGFCRSKSLRYTLDNDYLFYEYKMPYLVGYKQDRHQKSRGNKPRRPQIAQILFVTSCAIVLMNDLRWLKVKGHPPRSAHLANSKTRTVLIRAYTDNSTRRWFEIINRTIGGIHYVEYLKGHPDVTPSKHILSFCRTPDAPYLVLYDIPYDRELWVAFLRCLNSQSVLRVVDFSNMKLTEDNLTFPALLFGGVTLDRLDFSFNNVNLRNATATIFNALLPPLTCHTYNISHNPLGDCKLSSVLFVDVCLKAEAVKICFNHCDLGDEFLSHTLALLSQINHGSDKPRLELVELEGNHFSVELLCDFVDTLTETFPSVMSVRLYASVTAPELTEDMIYRHKMSLLDSYSSPEPLFGHFIRKKYVQKPKRTTRESVERLFQERQCSTSNASDRATSNQN
ncbi:hypothetical protein X943_003097 [Babesia divergens]|uniref:Uncharacterized protein n=1 Tax=Babesia divergens TaxID=32595 RepID=A0AAD9LJF5_BABDI|nr:hypothetical protein X943_003097 [Babesia divergens]